MTNFGTVTWTDSGLGAVNNLGTAFALPNQSIGAILVSGAANSTGTVSALTLSQIPEPSALALLGLGGLALVYRRRRS